MKSKKTILLVVLLAICLMATMVACKPRGGTLTSPAITIDGNVVKWQAVENADTYSVKVGNDAAVSVTTTSYTINKTAVGSYDVTVTAKSFDDKWLDSAPSNKVTFVVSAPPVVEKTPLAAPVITINNNVVSWTAVPHAASYAVTVGTKAAVIVMGTSYTITETAVGSYDVTVVAKANDDAHTDSVASNNVTYTIIPTEKTALTAPEIAVNGNKVTWTAVANAASYDVIVDDNAPVNVKTTSYTLPQTAVGSYKVTVVAKAAADSELYKDSVASDEVTYVIKAEIVVTLEQIDVDPVGVPTTIYLDQGITTLDLSRIVITAYYDNDTDKTITLANVTVGAYDLTTVGRKTITVSYTEGGVTKTYDLSVNVEERGIDDIDEYDTLLLEYSSAGTYTIDATTIRNMKGENVLVDGVVALSQGKTLLSIDDKFVVVTVAKFVYDRDTFLAIADDMSGYYVLTKNISFDSVWHAGAYIGAAPLTKDNVLDYEYGIGAETTFDDKGVGHGQLGVPFTGTFDGQGYALCNIKLHCSEKVLGHLAMGNAIFGYLGETGVIENVTLSNVYITSGKFNSFLVGYNEGTIKNIMVNADCSMDSEYSGGYLVAGYNNGNVCNVVSYVSEYIGFKNAIVDFAVANNSAISETQNVLHGTSNNGYICDTTDLTSTLGAGWKYFEDIGTVLANDNFIYVRNVKDTLSIGERWYLNIALGSETLEPVFSFYGIDNGEENNAIITVGWDSEKGSHYIEFTDSTTAVDLIGTSVTMVVHSKNWETSHSIVFTIAEASVTGYEKDTETLNVIEGTDIDLTAIDITEKYTDGSTQTIHPTKVEGFDKAGTVGEAQTVKAYYGEGDDDYVEIAVTLIAKSVESIVIDTTSGYKSVYNVDDELDLTGLKIVVSYNNGTSESITVTSAMLSAYDMSTSGAKQITITHGGKTCTLNITVQEENVTVTSIAVVGNIAKTTYKLNETVTVDDIVGATITATNSNSTTTPNIAITLAMVSCNFDTVGAAQITVTYEGQTATIDVTVVDYATALNVTATNTTLTYNAETTLDLIANATYTLTMASGATQSVNTGITASEYKAGLNTITYTYTGDDGTLTATQQYEIWYEISSATDWNEMRNNLAGYYVMTSDIDFYNAYIDPIGQAPLKVCANPDDGNEIDKDITDSIANLPARAFVGKFDGAGYVLKKAKIQNTAYTQAAAYCLSLFGFVGEGGEVRNVTLRAITIRGGKLCAMIAGYNLGKIENICVESDCSVYSHYNGGYVISHLSYGTINNVVSYMTTFDATPDAAWGGSDKPITISDGNTDRITNCYIGNATDLTTVENSTFTFDETTKQGWKYFENLGTVYVNSDYVYIRQTATDLPEDGKLYLYLAFVEDKNFIMQEWSDSDFEMRWDGTVGSHYIVVTNVGTEKTNIEINIRNGSWKGNHCIYINITEPQEGL